MENEAEEDGKYAGREDGIRRKGAAIMGKKMENLRISGRKKGCYK